MNGYTITVTCPGKSCGGELDHENGSNTSRVARAVALCKRCGCRFLIMVELTIIDPPGRGVGQSYMETPV